MFLPLMGSRTKRSRCVPSESAGSVWPRDFAAGDFVVARRAGPLMASSPTSCSCAGILRPHAPTCWLVAHVRAHYRFDVRRFYVILMTARGQLGEISTLLDGVRVR